MPDTPEELGLHHVVIRVRPSVDHGWYWKMGFGYLHVYLSARSTDEAADRASGIVEALPYDIVGSKCEVWREKLPLHPDCVAAAKQVEDLGLSLFLVACPPEAEEEDFATELGDDPEDSYKG